MLKYLRTKQLLYNYALWGKNKHLNGMRKSYQQRNRNYKKNQMQIMVKLKIIHEIKKKIRDGLNKRMEMAETIVNLKTEQKKITNINKTMKHY